MALPNLVELVQGIVEDLVALDDQFALSGQPYPPSDEQKAGFLPGLGSATEVVVRNHLKAALVERFPAYEAAADVRYVGQPRAKCDLVLTGIGDPRAGWAIELKKVAFVGDNGKNNDFGPSKVVSPYPIHRSSILDAQRLTTGAPADRAAVVLYGFDFTQATVDAGRVALRDRGLATTRADSLQKVLNRNKGDYTVGPTLRMFEAVAPLTGVRLGERVQLGPRPLNAHPIYRQLVVGAWEVIRATGRP